MTSIRDALLRPTSDADVHANWPSQYTVHVETAAIRWPVWQCCSETTRLRLDVGNAWFRYRSFCKTLKTHALGSSPSVEHEQKNESSPLYSPQSESSPCLASSKPHAGGRKSCVCSFVAFSKARLPSNYEAGYTKLSALSGRLLHGSTRDHRQPCTGCSASVRL